MSMKDYPTDELLAEIAKRVRPDSPLHNPQELRDMLIRAKSECSELLAQVEMKEAHIKGLEVANDSLTQYSRNLTAQRDALQARIDAGVRVWGKDLGNGEWSWGYGEYNTIDTHTATLIDPQPADHIADAGKMVDDDRKGKADRREAYSTGPVCRVNQTADTIGRLRTPAPNRRKTPGTKADRVKEHAVFVESGLDATSGPVYYQEQWTRADGSTTPRTGERRKGLEEFCMHTSDFCSGSHGPCWGINGDACITDNRRDPSGANDRRRATA